MISDCTAALEQDPKYMKALQRRAKAYEQNGDLTHCLEDISAVCILEGFKNERSLVTADRILQQIGINNLLYLIPYLFCLYVIYNYSDLFCKH